MRYMALKVLVGGCLLLACTAETPFDGGDCYMYEYVEQCRAAGEPDDVGVRWGCEPTHKPWQPDMHLISCVDMGRYKCCVAEER